MTAVRQPRGDVRVSPDPAALAEAVAEYVHAACGQAVAEHGGFHIALAGGGIANVIHETLAADPWQSMIPWDAWRVYFGDERAVPPDDEQSNFHAARTALLERVGIDPQNVHRMHGENPDLDAAALEYSGLLQRTVPQSAAGPRLDCLLLGLGENGHTASLFPGTEALQVEDRWATRGRADYAPYDRITLTFPAINAAARVAFAVSGGSKRDALQRTAAGSTPAARVQPRDGELVWFLDRAAAGDA